MPKKTKRQKIRSDKRSIDRQKTSEFHQVVKPFQDSLGTTTSSLASFTFTPTSQASVKLQNHTLATDYEFIKRDLIRITIFTMFALLVQGMLYFLLQR